MPVVPFTNGRLYVAGVDLSGHANQGVLELSAAELDASSISDQWDVWVLGRKNAALTASGHWEGGPDLPDGLFAKLGSTGQPMMLLPDGDAGAVGYALRSLPVAYSLGGQAGELVSFSMTARGAVQRAIRGTVVHDDSAAITATGDGTGYELGAVGSGLTLYGALHVLSASGTSPTLDVIVESDVDDDWEDPATVLTFTQATEAGAEWQSAAGPITDSWFRASFTVGGTDTPSFTAVLLLAIH